MRLGVVFPQLEIGAEPAPVRDYAQAAEELGYHHLLAFDQVLGLNPASRPDWTGVYTYRDMFHEPFVLFGFLAAVTKRIELMTGVLVLPQRQTALVAKQAAEVDVLSRGRLRLGIGVGVKADESEALGTSFRDRGRRSEEQIEVLRALWTKELVTFRGKWHRITDAGLNPLPVQRPIPIWFGATDERALRRAARLGDGWLPQARTAADVQPLLEKLEGFLEQAGRSRSQFGLEARMVYGDGDPETWVREARAWSAAGANGVALNTMRAGLTTAEDHLEAFRRFAEAMRGV